MRWDEGSHRPGRLRVLACAAPAAAAPPPRGSCRARWSSASSPVRQRRSAPARWRPSTPKARACWARRTSASCSSVPARASALRCGSSSGYPAYAMPSPTTSSRRAVAERPALRRRHPVRPAAHRRAGCVGRHDRQRRDVGVVDTGIAGGHPDLAANVAPGRDFVGARRRRLGSTTPRTARTSPGRSRPSAATASAWSGVAFGAQVQSLRVLGAEGSGTSADIAEAFAYAGAAESGSSTPASASQCPVGAMADAIALSPKTLFVVPAGNSPGGTDNELQPTYPCSLLRQHDAASHPATASTGSHRSRTTGRSSVDLAAPGAASSARCPPYRHSSARTSRRCAAGWLDGRERRVGCDHRLPGGDSPPYGAPYPQRERRASSLRQSLYPRASACAVHAVGCLAAADSSDSLIVEIGPSAGGPWTQICQQAGPFDDDFRFESDSFPTGSSDSRHLRLRFVSGADAAVADGVEVDSLALRCVTGSTYAPSAARPWRRRTWRARQRCCSRTTRRSGRPICAMRSSRAHRPVADLAARSSRGAASTSPVRSHCARTQSPAGDSAGDAKAAAPARTVDPRGEETTYHFDYGPTPAYGRRTAEVVLAPSSGPRR